MTWPMMPGLLDTAPVGRQDGRTKRTGGCRRVARKKVGFWYRLAVVVLKPPMLAVSRRDWRHTERLPAAGGIVVVANHLSHLDPLVMAHFLWDNGRPPRVLAKSSVFDWPVAGRVIRGAGQIPVHRETATAGSALRDAVAAVRAGEAVVVYPEGTITRDPRLWPMRGKTGAARIALTTGCPVLPLGMWGPQFVVPPYRPRVRLVPRRTVHVSLGPPVDLSDLMGRDQTAEVLDAATDRIMAALVAQIAELRGEPPPAALLDPVAAGIPLSGNPHVHYEEYDERRRTR
jgi:1-acyl-sn-glycerol-3-phosphate acyltransferase